MQREEIKNSINNVLQAAEKAQLERFFELFNSEKKDVDPQLILNCFSEFMNEYKGFSDAERRILSSFKLDGLVNADYWANFLTKDRVSPGVFYPIYSSYRSLKEPAQNFLPLLERESDAVSSELEGFHNDGSKEPVGVSSLKIFIRDEIDSHISVKQLAAVLSDICALYDIIVQLYKLNHIDLVVGSLDSGSDKSLDIVGVATAVDRLSSFFLETWDRIRFGKEQKIDKSFKSVSNGIELLEKVSKAIENKSISEQEGENIKRKITRSMDSLLKNGVYTQDIEESVPSKPSQISFERRLMITNQSPDDAGVDQSIKATEELIVKKDAVKASRRSTRTGNKPK